MITEREWAALMHPDLSAGPPAVVALEAWFSEGVSAASSWPVSGGKAIVEVSAHPDISAALRAAQEAEPTYIIVGKSLLSSPAMVGVPVEGAGMTSREAVVEFRRLIDEDLLRVRIAGPLADQALQLRTLPGADGPRLVSKTRTDAIKAAVWAAHRSLAAPEPAAIY